MKRTFIAIPIPSEIAASIIPLQTGLNCIRFSPPENFHITLSFIGNISEDVIFELDTLLSEIQFPAFDLRLEGADYFGNDKPYSLHLKVKENPELFALQKKCNSICAKLGLELDKRKYTPHLTLGYFSKALDIPSIMNYCASNALFKSKVWRANYFSLYTSVLRDGPSHYEILSEYPLKTPV